MGPIARCDPTEPDAENLKPQSCRATHPAPVNASPGHRPARPSCTIIICALTVVLARENAAAAGLPFVFEAAWLKLAVHTSWEAVGLTAAVAACLAEAGIPANVLAGYHHDHVLVPLERADEAVAALRSLR